MKAAKIGACVIAALALGGLSTGAVAQSVVANTTTAQINTVDHVSTVTVTRPDGGPSLGAVNFQIGYNNAEIALPTGGSAIDDENHPEITVSDSNILCVVNTVGTILCSGFGAIGGSTGAPVTIQIRFDVQGTAVADPGSPLSITLGNFADRNGNPLTPTSTNGGVIIVTAPPTPLTLSYAPAPGAITLPSGNAGATVSSNIVATAAGNSGSASLSCTAAAGFTVTPTLNFAAAGSQDIAVGCTLGATQTTGNIVCTEIDGNTAAPGEARTWTATCPQGGVVPVNPTITTVTATGAFAMPSGALGQTVSRLIDFSASGGAGSGSATINCTATAPVTVTPATQTVTGSAQPTDVAVRLQLTNAAQGPFDVVCTVTSGSTVRTDTFNVTAAAGTALPPPTVVPASSTWSQLLLIALMAGLGLAFVGFRRQS